MSEQDEAIEYLQHNSSNADTVQKMDEIKLCLTNLRGGDNGNG